MQTKQEFLTAFYASIETRLIASQILTGSDIDEIYKAVQDGQIQFTTSSNERIVLLQNQSLATSNPQAAVILDQILQCFYISDDNYNNWNDNMLGSFIADNVDSSQGHFNVNITESETCNPPGSISLEIALSFVGSQAAQTLVITPQRQQIDAAAAQSVLDTNIFELYPGLQTNQEKVDQLFKLYAELKPPKPTFTETGDFEVGTNQSFDETGQQLNPDGSVDANPSSGRITRLNTNDNTSQTLEFLYNDLLGYFPDAQVELEDSRPVYEEKSSGYLKIRNLNQMMIIRNEEGNDIGVENWEDGFTITMWVKFLDKTNQGTLFNYGNPLRTRSPKGIRLETIVENDKRYIRLVVMESNANEAKDSSLTNSNVYTNVNQLLEIPVDFEEWYFIVATYNPNVEDDNESYNQTYNDIPQYWTNNVDPVLSTNTTITTDLVFTHESNFGKRCKVEIISKTQLLKARGFQI